MGGMDGSRKTSRRECFEMRQMRERGSLLMREVYSTQVGLGYARVGLFVIRRVGLKGAGFN